MRKNNYFLVFEILEHLPYGSPLHNCINGLIKKAIFNIVFLLKKTLNLGGKGGPRF